MIKPTIRKRPEPYCTRLLAGAFTWSQQQPASALTCGVWRWPVKTLSDQAAAQVDYPPTATTVAHLRGLNPPSSLGETTPRIRPVEYTTWSLRADLVGAFMEDDHDYHVVIRSPASKRQTMIVEFPDIQWKGARSSAKKAAMKRARARFTDACGSIGTSLVDPR